MDLSRVEVGEAITFIFLEFLLTGLLSSETFLCSFSWLLSPTLSIGLSSSRISGEKRCVHEKNGKYNYYRKTADM